MDQQVENGNVGQDGGRKHPLKPPWGVRVGITQEVEQIFLPLLLSNAAVVPPCQGSTFEIPLANQNHGPKAKCAITEGKLQPLLPPLCFPSKCYNGNSEFIPLHPLFWFGFFFNLKS